MKAIISRMYSDGTFPEVGMLDRTIVEASTVPGIHRKAREYAKNLSYRAEIWFNPTTFYGEPNITTVVRS
jgi:hypothetical protein